MSPSPQLSPPGSSSYSSNTMSVGDGTWDSSRNDFLLPNLVGFNLATTQYNGMGNRFREEPEYHDLIRAHGIIAAITFLLIVPSAIMIARFYGRNPRLALRYHIWLQILTLLLTTVIFALGWTAVGPSRSLTNPHHGIGLTIFVLVLFQFFFGWWVHRRERNKKKTYEPLKVMFHHWLGRTIALLGLAQIPLGLALYGSPKTLFILYALAAFTLLVIYFILTHVRERRDYNDYDSRYSYGTGSVVDDHRQDSRQKRSNWTTGNVVKGALAGAGLYALVDRFRSRRSSNRDDGPEVVGSRRHSGSYVDDEKYSQDERYSDRGGKWEDRLYRVAVPLGAAGLVTWLLNRRHRDRDSDASDYGPPVGGAAPINDGRYTGEGGRPRPGGPIPLNQPLPSNQHPLNQPPLNQPPLNQPPFNQPLPPPGQRPPERPPSSLTQSSYESASHQRRTGHGFRDGLATLGAFGLARNIWNRRRGRSDEQRVEDEQVGRVNGNHFTGDGRPPRRHPPGESTLTTDSSSIGGHPQHVNDIPPIPAGAYPGGLAPPPVPGHGRSRTTLEELPLGGIPRQPEIAMPEIPPDRHGGLFHPDSSGSEVYIGSDGRNHWRHHAGRDAAVAGAVGATAGLAAAEAGSSRRDRQERHDSVSAGEEGMGSPPVSVKVKMHGDGRHVTLRRLPEAEAAAEREARRASRERGGRRPADSVSTLSGTDGTTERFRRRQTQERQQAEAMRIESERLAAARQLAQAQSNPNLPPNVPAPPPPPIPGSSVGPPPGAPASVGSPGTYDGNTTEASADYASNRRRRRAERAQAKVRENKRVEFE